MKCNLCNFKGDFLPMGERKNARCPNCKSLERHRDIVKYLDLSGRVLHISGNSGLCTYLAKQDIDYKVSFIESGGIDLEKTFTGQYNHIIALHVLEHLEHSQLALNNIAMALEKGGVLWLQVPFEKKLNTEMGHKQKYTVQGLKQKLTKAGFKSEMLDKRHKFFKCMKV